MTDTDDKEFSIVANEKTCLKSGCTTSIGKEHDYCHQHRD